MPNAFGFGPCRLVGVRVFTNACPNPSPAIEHIHRLIKNQPKAANGIGPEVSYKNTTIHGKVFGMCIHHQTWLRPGLAIIIAAGQHEKSFGTVAPSNPASPKPTLRGSLYSNSHTIIKFIVIVFRQRRSVHFRRDKGEICNPPHHILLECPQCFRRHSCKGSFRFFRSLSINAGGKGQGSYQYTNYFSRVNHHTSLFL